MRHCDRCGVKFTNVLEALDHQNNFKHTYKKMDAAKKAAIVARVESSLFNHLVGHGVPMPTVKATKIIIERFAEHRNEALAGLPEPNWVG